METIKIGDKVVVSRTYKNETEDLDEERVKNSEIAEVGVNKKIIDNLVYHTVYKVTGIDEDGDIEMVDGEGNEYIVYPNVLSVVTL